jgi:hypothetical protein
MTKCILMMALFFSILHTFPALIEAVVQQRAIDFSSAPRIGVLVHGYNTMAEGWNTTVWGDVESDRMGRISQAVAVISILKSLPTSPGLCHEDSAEDRVGAISSVLWGSGVPSLQMGITEGQFTLGIMRERFKLLRSFSFFREMADLDFEQLESLVVQISTPQNGTINTVTELESAFSHFEREGVNVVVLVSSAAHAPRCLRDACRILEDWGTEKSTTSLKGLKAVSHSHRNWRPLLLVSPAPTCFSGSSVRDVIIAEPPHLPHPSAPTRLLRSTGAGSGVASEIQHNDAINSNVIATGITSIDTDLENMQLHSAQMRRNSLMSDILHVDQPRLSAFNLELDSLLQRYRNSIKH